MAMRILVFGAILLSWVCSEEVKTKNGCNDELYKMCPDKPSVCRNETCKGAAVAGEEFKEAILKQLNDYRYVDNIFLFLLSLYIKIEVYS